MEGNACRRSLRPSPQPAASSSRRCRGDRAAVVAPSVVSAQGPDQHALAEHLAVQGHLPRIRDRLRQEGQRHDRRRPQDRGAARRAPWCRRSSLLDAVSKGTLDGGHGVLVYHYGKQTALALWGSGPATAWTPTCCWPGTKYGGGKELLDKLYSSIGANVVSFPYGPMPTQPLGWFKKPVTKADDFKGLKFRTVGISIDVFTGLGAAVNALPGGEIVPAMDRGLLDAAEFNNASSTASSASPTSPRSACCRATTRTPSSSRSCSTRPSTTRCRPR